MFFLRGPRYKTSSFDRSVNLIILFLVLAVAAISAVLAALHINTCIHNDKANHTLYLGTDGCDGGKHVVTEALSSFLRFLILFHNVVPVSLLATVQLIRIVQARSIRKDKHIYSEIHQRYINQQHSFLFEP